MQYEPLSVKDRETVQWQLNRRLRGEVGTAARCPYGEVEVIATSPLLPDGTPFPTLYWLTCPLLRREVSRLESGDFRDRLRRKLRDSSEYADDLQRAESDYLKERERWAEEMGDLDRVRRKLSGRDGIGGTVAGGMKCLHAHLAHFLAGGDNPVGAEVAGALRGLQYSDCGGDCRPFLRREPGGQAQ